MIRKNIFCNLHKQQGFKIWCNNNNIIIIIIRIFIQELTLQRVMLLSTCVLIKLNGKKENSKNLTYYENLQKFTLILIELLTMAIKIY